MTTGSALAQFTITLTQAAGEQVAVDWYTSDGTAIANVDYAANKGTVLFAPGETSKTVDILVYGRAVGSEDRSFFVEMLPPVNAILGASIGECIITVDTTGGTPVTAIIVPTGPRGLEGKSAYQVWLDLGNTGSEQDFIDSLSPPIDEIAAEVAPLIDVGATVLIAEGTEALGRPDATTVKAVARRIAYVSAAKIATVTMAGGDNLIAQSDLTGDVVNFSSLGLYPRIARGASFISPEWSLQADGRLLINDAIAGDVLYVCEYDVLSEQAFKSIITPATLQARDALRRSYKDAGYDLLPEPNSFEHGGVLTSAADVLLYKASGKAYSGAGPYPQTVAASSDPAVGGFVDRSSEVIRAKLNANTGAGLVRTTSSKTVQQELDALKNNFGVSVSLADYPDLKAAIAALPVFGGTVIIPEARFYAGDSSYDATYMAKDNVFLKGTKMPCLSSNADRLEGGSIIYGRFNAFAHNFAVENVGFDMGKYVIDTYYPGKDTHTADHPLGGTWDAFAFAQPNLASPLPARRGFRAENVIGLLRDSLSVGHAMLFEGIDGGNSYIDNATGIYGVHALVIKSRNIKIGTIAGHAASNNCVIIKSDSYALGGDLIIGQIDARKNIPGITPWSAPSNPTHGLLINAATANMDGNIQIGIVKALGVGNGVRVNGDPAYNVSDVQIGELIANGFGGSMGHALLCDGGRCSRFQVGILNASNSTNGVSWDPGLSVARNTDLTIVQAIFVSLTGQSIRAVGNAVIKIDVADLTACNTAYYIEDTAKLMVGTEKLTNVTTKWGRAAPALNAGWVNVGGGNSAFDIILHNYNVEAKGLVKAQAPLSADIVALPAYLKPSTSKRFNAYFNTGTRSTALVGVDSAASKVVLNDGTAPVAGDYVSLDGISWPAGG